MLLSHFVPCRQDVSSVRFFACTISLRAYQTAPPCQICKTFDAPVLCAATADVLRTGLHVQVSRVRRNRPVRVAAQRLQLSVYGRRSNRYAHCISTRTCSADPHCAPRRPRCIMCLLPLGDSLLHMTAFDRTAMLHVCVQGDCVASRCRLHIKSSAFWFDGIAWQCVLFRSSSPFDCAA